jgi:hypothetical protein
VEQDGMAAVVGIFARTACDDDPACIDRMGQRLVKLARVAMGERG